MNNLNLKLNLHWPFLFKILYFSFFPIWKTKLLKMFWYFQKLQPYIFFTFFYHRIIFELPIQNMEVMYYSQFHGLRISDIKMKLNHYELERWPNFVWPLHFLLSSETLTNWEKTVMHTCLDFHGVWTPLHIHRCKVKMLRKPKIFIIYYCRYIYIIHIIIILNKNIAFLHTIYIYPLI